LLLDRCFSIIASRSLLLDHCFSDIPLYSLPFPASFPSPLIVSALFQLGLSGIPSLRRYSRVAFQSLSRHPFLATLFNRWLPADSSIIT
jgi:hypothetical protein